MVDQRTALLFTIQVLHNIQHMARGQSGRLVFEIDPGVKRALHARVATEGRTLKDWFLEQVERYLTQPVQESLPFEERERGQNDD